MNALAGLFPPGIVAVEMDGAAVPDALFLGEEQYVASAVARRRLEFARGRTCARRALAALGEAPVAITSDHRAPIWPSGIVGSISHCAGYACAAVGQMRTYRALGVDAEVLQALDAGSEKLVVSPGEARTLAALGGGVPWACVAFSAKEAFYKAQYPRTRTFLDFLDVEVAIAPATGAFTVTVLDSAPALATIPRTVAGRFTFDGDRVLCAVVLPADQAS